MSEEKKDDLVLEDAVEVKPKSGVGIVKMTIIAAVVTAALAGGYVFLNRAPSENVVIGEPVEVSQAQPAQAQAPVQDQALIPVKNNGDESFDLLADAISEKGGVVNSTNDNQLPPDSTVEPDPSTLAKYVDIEKYNTLLADFDSVKRRLDALESEKNSYINSSESNGGNVEKRLGSLERRVSKVESILEDSAEAIAAMNKIVEQNKKDAFEREGNVRTDVPLSAKGRSRLVGYQYSMGTENKDVSIVVNESGVMTVLTTGVNIEYNGKKIPVTKVIDSEEVILVGDEFFIDKIKGVGPKLSQKAQVASANQDKRVSKQPQKTRYVSGWKILALTPDLNGGLEATIELPSGKLITLVRGETTKVYGKVSKIDESGVYFDGYKINTSGR